ncbi:MAG: hypothetical protein KGZ63_07420 [Clostridiales bacterium]|jgi:hypothetical protein|nr:hypothetical protein [Clostridiales bacterium]
MPADKQIKPNRSAKDLDALKESLQEQLQRLTLINRRKVSWTTTEKISSANPSDCGTCSLRWSI